MTIGCSVTCLRNDHCEPLHHPKTVHFSEGLTDMRGTGDGPSHNDTFFPGLPPLLPLRPAFCSDDCCYDFTALHRAQSLSLELFFQDADEILNDYSQDSFRKGIKNFLSICTNWSLTERKLTFLDTILAHPKGILENISSIIWDLFELPAVPHYTLEDFDTNFDSRLRSTHVKTSNLERQDHLPVLAVTMHYASSKIPQGPKNCRYNGEIENDWGLEEPPTSSLHSHRPTIPDEAQPQWVREIREIILNEDSKASIQIRSWYLNPNRFEIWASWRPISLSPNMDHWPHDVRAVWHDIFEHEQPVDFHVVLPQPPRPDDQAHFVLDLILAQELQPDHSTALILTAWKSDHLGPFRTIARIMPQRISKWELIYGMQLDRYCGGPGWSVPFYRKCKTQICTGQNIGAPHIDVPFGSCLGITMGFVEDIVPWEDDTITFMAAPPNLLPPDPAIADMREAAQDSEDDFDNGDQDAENSDPSEEADPNSWHTIQIYSLAHPPAAGRVDWSSYDSLHRTISDAMEISRHDLQQFWHVRATPLELEVVNNQIFVALQQWDILPGHQRRLVLVDVEFHSLIPTKLPETVREARLLPHRVTRAQILSKLGLAPYCQESTLYGCMLWLNNILQFSQHAGFLEINNGDHLRIAVPPEPTLLDSIPTRTAAALCYRGFGRGDINVAHLQNTIDPVNHTLMPLLRDHDEVQLLQLQAHLTFPGKQQTQPTCCRLEDDPTEPVRQVAEQNAQAARQQTQMILNVLPRGLSDLWLQHAGALETPIAAEDTFGVITWFLHAHTARRCNIPRGVHLPSDPMAWLQILIQIWHDEYDHTGPVEFHLVRPQPYDMEHGFLAHLIIVQVDNHIDAGILFTVYDNAVRDNMASRFATLASRRLHHDEVLHHADSDRLCRLAGVACQTWVGWDDVTNWPFFYGSHGMGITLSITRPLVPLPQDEDPWRDFEVEAEENLNLLQVRTSGQQRRHNLDEHAQVQASPERHCPTLQGVQEQTESPDRSTEKDNSTTEVAPTATFSTSSEKARWIQDLQDTAAVAHQEARTNKAPLAVQTWYLSHRYHQRCVQGRPILLGPQEEEWEQEEWEQQILRAWTDLIDPLHFYHIELVRPSPPAVDSHIAVAHLIISQHRVPVALFADAHVEVVITVLFENHMQPQIQQLALIIPAWSLADDLFDLLQLLPLCQQRRSQGLLCTVHHGPNIFELGLRDLFHHGDSAIIRIPDRPTEAEVTVSPLPPRSIKLDIKDVQQCWFEFENIFVLPVFDLTDIGDWHPAWSWCQRWWNYAEPIDEVQIYFDGSSKHNEGAQNGSIGVAAFVRIHTGWYFAGAISAVTPPGTDSFTAEQIAGATAAKFLFDILKIGTLYHNQHVDAHMCFDSLTVGHQATGNRKCISSPTIGSILRSITRVCQLAFDVTVSHWHVRGHAGEPGNELVDELARLAMEKAPLHDLTEWQCTINDRKISQKLEWAWILFDSHYMDYCDDGTISLPAAPSTTPTVDNIGVLQTIGTVDKQEEGVGRIDLHLCSYNAMTLKDQHPKPQEQLATPAKLECLLQQLYNQKVTIFGIQETRMRNERKLYDSRYHIYNTAATVGGHAGILIGVAKSNPIGKDGASNPIYIMDKDIGILHADPRRLLLRISANAFKCLTLACHAPHTGQSKEEIEHWWSETSNYIPQSYRGWPLIILADANARVGRNLSCHVGSWNTEDGGDKAEPFEDFLARHDLLLPSTFTEYHQGPSATWTHSRGQTSRIDYIGVPMTWQTTAMESWVCNDLETPLPRDDHFPVHLRVQLQTAFNQKRKHFTRIQPRIHSGADFDLELLSQATTFDWQLDVHSHAEALQQDLLRCTATRKGLSSRKPLRTTMSSDTWELVQEKRDWRRHLADANHTQKLSILRTCFAAWANSSDYTPAQQQQIQQVLRAQDQLIATALAHFRALGRLVTQAMRKDDITFYQGLLEECAEFTSPSQAKQLWQTLRRSLPKMKNRRKAVAPLKNLELEDQWIPHLSKLETGQPCSAEQLLQLCQLPLEQPALPDELDILQLPSLHRLETAFRATTPGKSTGLDPIPADVFHTQAPALAKHFFSLLVKTYLWADEPVQYKGGKMALLHKREPLPMLPTIEASCC